MRFAQSIVDGFFQPFKFKVMPEEEFDRVVRLKESLKDGTVWGIFEVSNVDAYLKRENPTPEECFDVVFRGLPFHNMWFEWCREDAAFAGTHVRYYDGNNSAHRVVMDTYIGLSTRRRYWHVCRYRFTVDKETGKLRGNENIMETGVDIEDDKNWPMVALAISSYKIVGLSIGLLHVKNSKTINEKLSSRQVRRARERQHKPPEFVYKTLWVKSMRGSGAGDGHSGEHYSLHICRGHFKDYTQGPGLFGKYHGVYWWDEMVKGRISEGVVIKDYKVKTR
jgi:hypothetical protein